jgi:hypothetical protein
MYLHNHMWSSMESGWRNRAQSNGHRRLHVTQLIDTNSEPLNRSIASRFPNPADRSITRLAHNFAYNSMPSSSSHFTRWWIALANDDMPSDDRNLDRAPHMQHPFLTRRALTSIPHRIHRLFQHNAIDRFNIRPMRKHGSSFSSTLKL